MIATLALACSLLGSPQDGVVWKKVLLNMPVGSKTALMYQGPIDPIDPPKLSPKRFGTEQVQWEFPWMVEGFAQSDSARFKSYFRVFAQEQKGDKPSQISQMLLRLWDCNYKRLRLSHNPQFHDGLVEVYLCFGGKAGGEQILGVDSGIDVKTKRQVDFKVNTIYIYDMGSFTDPIEMAREVAHEYGHATLPPIGGYSQPEDWADGYLGEKLYLRWMRDGLAKGELVPGDVMGLTKEDLDKWVTKNVDPLIEKAAQTLPTANLLADKSENGMNSFIGLALYIDTLYGDAVLSRSLQMAGTDGKDYPANTVLAAEEPETITLNIPPSLIGKPIWIPLGTGKLKGLPWLKHDPSGWAQIQPKTNQVVITNWS